MIFGPALRRNARRFQHAAIYPFSLDSRGSAALRSPGGQRFGSDRLRCRYRNGANGNAGAGRSRFSGKLRLFRGIKIHSVSTHLPVSNEDADYTLDELSRFGELVGQFRVNVPGNKDSCSAQFRRIHFSESAFDLVRAGLMLYGISPFAELANDLSPVMSWKTRIGLIRDMPKGSSISYGRTFITAGRMKVATLTAGYADGYPRHLSNREWCPRAGETLCFARTRDDGLDDDRCMRCRRRDRGRRSGFNGATGRARKVRQMVGRTGEHHFLGNHDSHRQLIRWVYV